MNILAKMVTSVGKDETGKTKAAVDGMKDILKQADQHISTFLIKVAPDSVVSLCIHPTGPYSQYLCANQAARQCIAGNSKASWDQGLGCACMLCCNRIDGDTCRRTDYLHSERLI